MRSAIFSALCKHVNMSREIIPVLAWGQTVAAAQNPDSTYGEGVSVAYAAGAGFR